MGTVIQFPQREEEPLELTEEAEEPVEALPPEPWPSSFWILGAILGWSL
jgi:hypothetical protein